MSAVSSNHHQATVLTGREKLEILQRKTPTPGPTQVLVQAKQIAINPVDHIMRDMGFNVKGYPSVLGSDIGGIVVEVGDQASTVSVGDRVAAHAPAFDKKGDPDYGAYQEFSLVPQENLTRLPDDWKKKAMLVWGAGGSIGTVAVQVAKALGFTVYATASTKHHEYLKSLGAHKCFDYSSNNVVAELVAAAEQDVFILDKGYLATGDVGLCAAAVGHFKVAGAKVALAPFSVKMLWWKLYNWDGVAVQFVDAQAEPGERTEFFKFVYTVWLKEKLENKLIVASPKIEEVAGGLTGLDGALNKLKGGVSGIKFVVAL
ncbi:UNVERIFIED_CONTAM: hypothetical protein HDU68_009975 [Siphonaria sp. JEL0065]|nr:hypothetical protein HDU68_009975 [Siphonaria sp. JEL0065]